MKIEIIRNDERLVVEETEIEKDDLLVAPADWDYDISDENGLI